jgi:L-ornithine N5-monooxygenase
VRLELIEQLYEKMYDQRREFGPDESRWPHQILGGWDVVEADFIDGKDVEPIKLIVRRINEPPERRSIHGLVTTTDSTATLGVDLVVAATGYRRNAHVDLLRDTWPLLPEMVAENTSTDSFDCWVVETEADSGSITRKLEVDREYRVRFAPGAVAFDAGIWLQGCCEGTHGVSQFRKPIRYC